MAPVAAPLRPTAPDPAVRLALTPGTWTIDPTHSNVEFVVRHFFTRMRGRFTTFSGTVTLPERTEDARVDVQIQAASLDTQLAERDAHLRSADFLDADHFPVLGFRSTAVRVLDAEHMAIDGELTLRGVSRPVSLEVEFTGRADDPWGGQRAGFSARAEVDRHDFGMTWNIALETGGVVVGRTVNLELEIELVRTLAG